MLTKAKIYHTVEKLPKKFSVEQLVEQLIFIEKVEKGLEQSRNGQTNSKEQTKSKLSKWLK
jgi:hypothetical protein